MSHNPYPHRDGDHTVIGPECFASEDGSVICWKGENYERQSDAERMREALERIASGRTSPDQAAYVARAALNPEQGK